MLTIYGTVTSPFVRRVRIVAHELSIPQTLLDVNDPEIQAAMRRHSPVWKVPVAQWQGRVILDSHTITEVLMAERGPGPLLPFDALDVGARNAIAVIDGATDALINAFYLGKDGVGAAQSSYLRKQVDRAAAALQWIDARVEGGRVDVGTGFAAQPGLVEIALLSALGWMQFRRTYPIEQHPRLLEFLRVLGERPSVACTAPDVPAPAP